MSDTPFSVQRELLAHAQDAWRVGQSGYNPNWYFDRSGPPAGYSLLTTVKTADGIVRADIYAKAGGGVAIVPGPTDPNLPSMAIDLGLAADPHIAEIRSNIFDYLDTHSQYLPAGSSIELLGLSQAAYTVYKLGLDMWGRGWLAKFDVSITAFNPSPASDYDSTWNDKIGSVTKNYRLVPLGAAVDPVSGLRLGDYFSILGGLPGATSEVISPIPLADLTALGLHADLSKWPAVWSSSILHDVSGAERNADLSLLTAMAKSVQEFQISYGRVNQPLMAVGEILYAVGGGLLSDGAHPQTDNRLQVMIKSMVMMLDAQSGNTWKDNLLNSVLHTVDDLYSNYPGVFSTSEPVIGSLLQGLGSTLGAIQTSANSTKQSAVDTERALKAATEEFLKQIELIKGGLDLVKRLSLPHFKLNFIVQPTGFFDAPSNYTEMKAWNDTQSYAWNYSTVQVVENDGTVSPIVQHRFDRWTGQPVGSESVLVGFTTEQLNQSEGVKRQATIDGVPVGFESIGSIFGSNLARLIDSGKDPWGGLAIGTALGTLGLEIGKAIDGGTSSISPGIILKDLRDAGVGAVSSYLFAQLVNEIGISGFGGAAISSVGGQTISKIAVNLLHSSDWVNASGEYVSANASDAIKPVEWNTGLNQGFFLNAGASFLGSYLASQLVHFNTIEGQIGASIGAAVGGIVIGGAISGVLAGTQLGAELGSLLGPIGTLIGAFIGFIVGGLIGSMFGGTSRSGAELSWNGKEFQVGYTWSHKGGSEDGARSIASTVSETLNGVLSATGSKLLNPNSVRTGTYGMRKSAYVYWASGTDSAMKSDNLATYDNANGLITHGTYIALSDMAGQLAGGDVYVKRALASTLAAAKGNPASLANGSEGQFGSDALLGNISAAQDYEKYLSNAGMVNALIAAEPTSTFTATWLVTIAQAEDLGLNKRATTDWIGGWSAFLDETMGGAIDSAAYSPASLSLQLGAVTSERTFSFTNEDGYFLGSFGDTIATADKTKITATSGADTITVGGVKGDAIANTTGLTIDGSVANGAAKTIRVAAVIDAGDGDDVVQVGDLGNDALGGAGNDTLVGGKLDDWLLGGDGNDRLFAGGSGTGLNTNFADTDTNVINAALAADGGNGNYLEGGAGDDRLYGGKGSDWLSGGSGDDKLYGGAGGDILSGGIGTDKEQGGDGSDQYVFNIGDGHDTVFDIMDPGAVPGVGLNNLQDYISGMSFLWSQRNWAGDGNYSVDGSVAGGDDAIAFGPGINMSNIRIARSGNDLIVKLGTWDVDYSTFAVSGDELTLQDWFDVTRRVEWFRFADGEEIRVADFASYSTITGTGGDDTLIGTDGNDFIFGLAGNDKIRALSGNDFGYGGPGDDFITGDAGNDLIVGGDGEDQVQGGSGNDTLTGDGGNDIVYGGDGNDIVSGGKDNDILVGGAGDDVFKIARGDGHDVVLDDYADNWEVVWTNAGYQNGYVLGSDGKVTKDGQLYFDGSNWQGNYTYDTDTKVLKRFIGAVNGAVSCNAGTDTIEFQPGVNIQDLKLQRSGNDLVLGIGSGENDATSLSSLSDTVEIKDWYSIGPSIEKVSFAETGVFNISTWSIPGNVTDSADTITGTSGTDWITGLGGDDTIDGAAGDDILAGNEGGDTLKGGAGVDILYGGAGDDTLDGGAGSDKLFGGDGEDIASYASASSGVRVALGVAAANTGDAAGDSFSGIEDLEGSSHNDTLIGSDGANLLRGGAGDDLVRGGFGDDTYAYKRGDGNDVIDEVGISGVEQILAADGSLNTDLFAASWQAIGTTVVGGRSWYAYRLTVTRNGTSEVVYRSRDNVDFLYTSANMPVPSGAAWPFADGQWLGDAVRTGNGVQTVRTLTGQAGGDDAVLLDGIALGDLGAVRNGADLVLTVAGGGQITIKNQTDASKAVESLMLGDGLVASLTNLRLAGEAATSAGDFFLGDANANSFDGGAGDDVISGAGGNDVLLGGDGNDTLEGGAGADTLDGGSDSMTLGAAPPASTAAYGDTIRYAGSTAGVTIDLSTRTASGGDAEGDVIVADANGVSTIENVIGSNAIDVLTGDNRANRLAGLDGDDVLTGLGGDDVLIGGAGNDTLDGGDGADNISGGDGNDTLTGGAGNDLLDGGDGVDTLSGGVGEDTLVGGDGNDTLSGGADNDRVSGGAGVDILYGDDGDDTLSGGEGNDTLYGGAGNDTLSGDAGDDHLEGGAGDDTYVFDRAAGSDTILDSDDKNKIVMSGVTAAEIWLARASDDLVIGTIGGGATIRIQGYYASSSASRMYSLATSDKTLFLAYAEPLISAMTAASANAPQSMPSAISNVLATYWDTGSKAAPRVVDQSHTFAEDSVLQGNVGAIDHDENITSYALATAAGHGTVALNAGTGTWSYTPASNYNGTDSFAVRVTDADGQSVVQTVSLTLTPVNDTPALADAAYSIAENVPTASHLASLVATDPDNAASDLRYELIGGDTAAFDINPLTGELTTKAFLDYETRNAYSVQVRVWDGGAIGAGLSGTATVNINVTDVNEAPTDLRLTNATTAIAENTTVSSALKVADLSYSDDALGTNAFSLSGADAGFFQIVGNGLYLKAGTVLNFEAKSAYNVTVAVADVDGNVGGGAGSSKSFTLNVTDVNEAPTSLSLAPSVSAVAERDRPDPNQDAPAALKLGVLSATDPDLPTSGDFAQLAYSVADTRFEVINGNELWLKAGAMGSIDYEAGTTLSVEVTVKDRNGAAGGLALTKTFTFAISDQVDVLQGGTGADTLTGQQGRDILRGLGGDDILSGGAGNDDLLGGSGNDTLRGDAGNDYLQGDDGNDTLYGGDGADTLLGGDGGDILCGDAGNDTLDAGAGDDTLDGGVGADVIQGGAGTDTLTYANSSAAVTVNLANGTGTGGDADGDTISGIERLIGSGYADSLTGTTAADYIDGGAGNDTITGNGGVDVLHGGYGNDTISLGNDGGSIYGEAGDDIMTGGAGVDYLYGGDGNDHLYAFGAGDVLTGGAGDDYLDGGSGSDEYVLDANSGNDTIYDYDALGTDQDKLNYNGLDVSRLWFERVGNNLKITVVGGQSTATIVDWYAATTPPANARIEFVLGSQFVTRDVNVDGLISLMHESGRTMPTDVTALNTLMSDTVYKSRWAAYWNVNDPPALASIAAQTTSEDAAIAIAINASDDYTSKDHLVYELHTYSDAARTQENTASVVKSWNVATTSTSQTLNITPSTNYGGTIYATLKVADLTGRVDQKDFTLNVTPVADTPSLTTPASLSGTLDGGSLALNISADLVDTDGSETLQILISGLPSGLALNKGTNLGGGSWSLTKADLSGLAITGPTSWATDFTLTIRATATEALNGATASTTNRSVSVTINARPSGITGTLGVNENAANGTLVGTLIGQDGDGDALTYSLVNNAGGRFAINATTGAVTVANGSLLNYEAASSATITARVADPSGLTRDVSFTVAINDLNEAPSLGGGSFSVQENCAVGTAVGTLAATDPDTNSAYRNFRYELISGDTGTFAINATTGQITTVTGVNYEAKSSYSVQARVWDGGAVGTGNSATTTVTISIADVNEAPSLSGGPFSVTENCGTGTAVGALAASDPDTNAAYRNFRYELISGDTSVFAINQTTGQITTTAGINYEAKSSYSVQARVWDGGAIGSGNSATATVTINVADVNETPSLSGGPFSVTENCATGTAVGTLAAVDPDSNSAYRNFRYELIGGDTGTFAINQTTGQISTAGAVDYESHSSYNVQARVWDGGAIGSGNAATTWVTINTIDVNEPVSLSGGTFSVVENSPPAGQTCVGTITALDPDTNAAYRNFRYELIGGDTGMFSVGSTNGNLMLQGSVDYETRNSYSVQVRVWDGGGIGYGNSAIASYAVNVTNVNEAPYISRWSSSTPYAGGQYPTVLSFLVADPEGDTVTVSAPSLALQSGGANSYTVTWEARTSGTYTYSLRFTDSKGAYSDHSITLSGSGASRSSSISPIIFDLDDNGIDLVSSSASNIWFDMDGDGYRDQTGWVGPNDGILAIDRNGDGTIDNGSEINFSQDVSGAVSDLEGLRAYDTNNNGVVDSSDQKFADLHIWRDINQNGMCDAGELKTLSECGVAAINLTINPTGEPLNGAVDNVLYGTTQYQRLNGSSGTVGDVFLRYAENDVVVCMDGQETHYHIDPVTGELTEFTPHSTSGQLAPIVLDLNGDGVVSLESRRTSNTTFDMDDSGVRQKTGWVGAGDGLLVLDRDGDGKITKGSEISFKNDLAGATSDLEGLRAYDTNQNGLLDTGDAKFALFRVWRDANQDGVCGSDELKSLADYGIKGINLTRNMTGQTADGATDNVTVATADVLHTDGRISTAGDVFLSYDADPAPAKPLSAAQRTALLVRAKQASGSIARLFDNPRAVVRAPDNEGNTPDSNGTDIGAGALNRQEDSSAKDDFFQTSLAAEHAAGAQSALDSGLSVLNRNVLQMVSAMSTFNSTAPGQMEIGGRKHRPEGTEYLTALPNLRSGNSLNAA